MERNVLAGATTRFLFGYDVGMQACQQDMKRYWNEMNGSTVYHLRKTCSHRFDWIKKPNQRFQKTVQMLQSGGLVELLA